MKSILCFGDSNTWGWNPENGKRFTLNERWTGLLMKELGSEYYVIEEGLSGRTAVFDDPYDGKIKNGKRYLAACLESHMPIDLVVMMLGSNESKNYFSLSASDIYEGICTLAKKIKNSKAGPNGKSPELLIMAPPIVLQHTRFSNVFDGACEKLEELSQLIINGADSNNYHSLDLSRKIICSSVDGVHLEASEHKKICSYLVPVITNILEKNEA